MAISINSNPATSSALFGLQREQDNSFAKIASGKQINTAADNAAGLAIAIQFTSQIDGFSAAIDNANDGVSLAQTGAAGLSNVTDSLQRIRELAVQAGSGTLDSNQRGALQTEANALRDEIARVSESASFNGQSLLAQNQQLDIQVGGDVGDTTSLVLQDIDAGISSAGVGELDFSSPASATGFLSAIDDSLSLVSQQSSAFGAFQNSLVSAVDDLSRQSISASESRSRIEDTDYAKQAAFLVTNKISQQAGIAVQVQANANQGIVNQLLG